MFGLIILILNFAFDIFKFVRHLFKNSGDYKLQASLTKPDFPLEYF